MTVPGPDPDPVLGLSALHRDWARALLDPWGRTVDLGHLIEPADAIVEPADAIGDWARSGVLELTGRAEGPPLVPPGCAASAARGAELAFATLARHQLDIELIPVGWHRLPGERAALSGVHRRDAPWSVGGAARAVETADGWVALSLARPDDVILVGALVEADAVPPNAATAWAWIDTWARQQPASTVVARTGLLGLPGGVIPEPGRWSSRPERAVGSLGSPISLIDVATAAAPALGRPPLVVDFSALWAGPLCAQLLSLAGARVVKVELPTRLDGARRGVAAFYELLHAGHESVVLDPHDRHDAQRLARLLDRADVIIEASRPQALAALGIDALRVCERSPTTWVSITAWGRDYADRVGFGDDVAMAAGLVTREDSNAMPFPVGDAFADPITGMHAAVAALASYCHGGSRLLDVAMRDVVAMTSAWHDPGPAQVISTARGWAVESAAGTVPVCPPFARAAGPGRAPRPGEHSSMS